MAQGRGNAYAAAMLLISIGLQSCLCHQAYAATYTVGGSQGWDVGVDYTTWVTGLTFKVGDILFFPYLQAQHDVVVIDKAGYDACSAANAIATYSEGNTNVTLSATGAHYYLCSVVGHCAAGMKLAVTVTAAAASPPVSAPTPAKTPSSPPTTAPASSTTPSSAAAPTPTVEAPASAPTPSSPAPASAPTPVVAAPVSAPTPTAPGSTPSLTGTPPSPPSPPNAATSLFASASIAPLLALSAAVFL